MKVLRYLLYLILILVGAFLLFLLYASIDDYRPDEKEVVFQGEPVRVLCDSSELRLLNWNIGYAGLDASMDFFYDGGEQMRPVEAGVISNINGIMSFLETYRDHDFILLQEVDRDSKRSYHMDQVERLGKVLSGFHPTFGKNYDVSFVPIPLKEPMGKVRSGLLTMSAHECSNSTRYSFPGNYSWPMSLFMLDRCFLVNRYVVSGDRELVLINTHNSAYDDGSLRTRQMDHMKEFLLEEYQMGNYVLVGGDWNQTPHGFEPEWTDQPFDTLNLTYIEQGYPANGWTWAFDYSTPSNRRVKEPYSRGSSLTTVIDGYLLSPNIRLKRIQTHDMDFQYSDHQPVELHVVLIPE